MLTFSNNFLSEKAPAANLKAKATETVPGDTAQKGVGSSGPWHRNIKKHVFMLTIFSRRKAAAAALRDDNDEVHQTSPDFTGLHRSLPELTKIHRNCIEFNQFY